ncbi:hypothetical protein LIER_01448 [Lithospermum erythrorhizon]|uniref:RNA-polymerase II-associated protein 3-like C-terminal domain-containing protein n=1 Tax=Lithospermum erythrorhizon TaxID=34254 RepID=A0AAV3NL08_LITER
MAAKVPTKHGRDGAPDFEGMLNNLQDWELSYKDKEKKIKSHSNNNEKLSGPRVNGSQTTEKVQTSYQGAAKKYDYMNNYDSVRHLSTGLMTEEGPIDANSEKELGNEYFKQKKFNEAIDCYSRSIAFSPTAVTYANRAMAYLKIKRFQEAENDCTEALSLDDRYIKAYSRRSTAKKELGKLRESIEDAEFALRLEPHNQEIKKQYSEVKSLYEKELLKKASGAGAQGVMPKIDIKKAVRGGQVDSSRPQQGLVSEIPEEHIQGNGRNEAAYSSMEIDGNARGKTESPSTGQLPRTSAGEIAQKSTKNGKQELKGSLLELSARAASLAKAEAAKNIVAPNSAYQFEASWRGLSGDRSLQAHLLKVTPPTNLPQIFKNALSPSLLIDIIKCVATFFIGDMDLAVKYLENFVKVPRFDMIIMSLPAADKADLCRIWDEVFIQATPEYAEILQNLRSRYIIKL